MNAPKYTKAEQIIIDRLRILYDLRDLLYAQLDCGCGGPLHVILDDSNVRDSDLAYCYQDALEEKWQHVKELCVAILDMLKTLSPAQRLYWWECRDEREILAAAGKDIVMASNGYEIEG